MNTKVAVILAGCGAFDGSEVSEVILTLLELEKNQLHHTCFAPDMQTCIVNHFTQQEQQETRNVLEESARIVRGQVQDLSRLNPCDYEALVIAGGFGVARNLSNLASSPKELVLHPELAAILTTFKEQKKYVGALCIAPAILPLIYPDLACTVGHDEEISARIQSMGGRTYRCEVNDYYEDMQNKVLSTPAYMLAQTIHEAHQGIAALVAQLALRLKGDLKPPVL